MMRKRKVFTRFLVSYVLILVVPLGIGSVAYMKAGRIVEQESTRYNMAMLQQVRQVIDSQLTDMKQLAIEIAYNPSVQAMLTSGAEDEGQGQVVIKTLNDLFRYKTMNQFIYDFYVYFAKSDTIISPNGQWKPSFFYNGLYRYEDISYNDWYNYLKRQDGFCGYIPLKTVKVGKWPENIITYVQPIMWHSNTYSGNLFVLINERNIYDLLKNIELANHGVIYVVDGQNQLIASTVNNYDNLTAPISIPQAPVFKNMIGQDGILNIDYNGEKVVASYATSYVTDWKYVSIVPISFFMDKVEYIKSFTLWVMLICLAVGLLLAYLLAYRNYNPIKELVKILSARSKSMSQKACEDEYDFIKEIVESTIDESQNIQEALATQRPMLRANLLLRLMHGRVDSQKSENIVHALKLFDIKFISDEFAVMLIDIDDRSEYANNNSEYEWALARFITTNIMEEIGNRTTKSYMVEIDKTQLALLVNFDSSNIYDTKSIMESIANETKSILEREFKFFLTVGISNVHSGVLSIEKAYREALAALNYRIVKGSDSIIFYGDIKEDNQDYYYPLDVELQLINSMKAGEFEKANDILDNIFCKNFTDTNLPYRLIQCLFFDIMSTAIKVLNEIKIKYEDIFGSNFNPVEQILNCQTMEQMHSVTKNIYEQICKFINENRKSHNVQLKEKIMAYIDEHYSDMNLGVATIAEHFGLNPSYLSYFFKEQTNQNMTDYINSVRLKKAKELLLNENLTINKIAEMVGYGTAARFIRVFKKGEGITPGEYRNGLAF